MRGAASPTALERARITPVKIPPSDAGKTWYHMVCHFEAPMAYEASLIDCGTALMLSLVETMITGRISRDKVMLPARTLGPIFNILAKISSPNNPYMIEGTPARLEILISSNLESHPFLPYSSRYTPAPTPTGKEIPAVKIST